MAQDLGLISRRGVERLIRGDVDPDRLIEEAEQVKNMSSMDLYKKYLEIKKITWFYKYYTLSLCSICASNLGTQESTFSTIALNKFKKYICN